MVFESIVVDVLNRFLGEYVENLNGSQLKLGIWGGDVVLENLVLKQNALEELNIPVQTIYGHLGKLTLKIPWKNLYGASVEATVERLLLVVNPNAEVKYDHEKEEKLALAAKQAELARVEEAKKKEAEEDKMDETFVEKLVTQIIKNVQLTIKDIHVRYEDSITNPKNPFSLGMTLHNLSVHTTDENWKQTVITEAVTKIYKILSLEGLAIYWNPETELYAKTGVESIQNRLQQEIATKTKQPSFYSYALGPINATAKLKLNPKPEGDTPKFSIPKITLSLHMEQLSISLSKAQYRDMMLMFDSMDRMSKGAPYRKYRPDLVKYRGHYKEWWQFAFKCILEEEVRRRRNNWDWAHMLRHRQLCKNYATAYQCKLTSKGKVNNEQQCVLDEAEKKLDLLNLVVIRQRIEMEVERLGKLEAEARKSRGWFGGWWSSANAKDDQLSENTDLLKQFQNAMTPAEKEKLFRAIDYQENTAPLHLPVEYVAVSGEFRLDRLQLKLTQTDDVPVLAAAVDGVSIDFYQRPSGNAIRTEIQMHTFTVSGTQQGGYVPAMVVSKEVAHDVHLLHIIFETNPIDKTSDQRVKLVARPLQIVYDAQTVIRIVEVFKPPEESTALTTLQAAAGNKLSDLKEKSALGMQYAVHQHTFIELDVDVAASYIIIPHGGQYTDNVQCCVVKLGAIRLKSEPRAAGGPLDVAKLYRSGLDDEHVMREIAKHSYDKITLALTQMQIVVAKKGEDWNAAISADEEATPLHLLQPTNLIVQIHKCLITDDPRLPKVKVRGELEKIAISISQDRLLSMCEILVSMPLPESDVSTQLKSSESKGSSLSLLTKYLDPAEKQKRESARMMKEKATGEPTVQLTEVEAFFVIKEVTVSVNRTQVNMDALYEKFLVFGLNSLELTVNQKTFNLEAMVRLGAVSMSHHRVGHKTVFIIDTPEGVHQIQTIKEILYKDSEYLITICYCNVDKKCPEFRSLYGSVEQLIELKFTKLKMHLHLQSLQEIMTVVNEYQTRLADIRSTQDRRADAGTLETIFEDEETAATKSKTSVTKLGSKKTVESIQIKMKAHLGTVEIEFTTDLRPISVVRLQGMRTGAVVKASYTEVDFNIASLSVRDLNVTTLHKDILKVVGGDVVNVRVVMFNTDVCSSEVDMSIDAQLNTLRIIFINWFVTSMLDFLNNFQTAQQAIKDVSAQAAEAARERAAQAYQNSTKVLLKVRMAAPIIIVPENSRSSKALIVDLGTLNINNRFINLKVEDSSKTITVDELTLELEEMKVSCAEISGERGVHAERELLRPTSFKLLVKRSLSTWHDALPDLDVSGRINSITITVGNSDYKSIMKILNQNLTEGQEVAQKSQSVSKTVSKTTLKNQSGRVATKSSVAVVETKEKKEEKLKTTMKFCFTMDKFLIHISTTTNGEECDEELATFTMSVLSLKGRMFSDGSMHTTLLLVDCTVDDSRPNRGDKIIRYLGRRTRTLDDGSGQSADASSDKIRSMVDLTFTQKNQDTFIDLRIFSFNLIFAMDFLNKLADFATSGLAADPPDAAARRIAAPLIDLPSIEESADEEQKSLEEKLSSKKRVQSERVLSDKEMEPVQSMLTVNIKIEQPDIILVESLVDRTCDAFVLNMEARLKLRRSAEHMVAEGGISSLQVTARRLDEVLGAGDLDPADLPGASAVHLPNVELVPDTSSTDGRENVSPEKFHPRYLLAPTHMSLAISQPPGSGMHVDIAITDIKITISPDMLALLMRVLATMQRSEESDSENEQATIMYHSVWDIRPIKPDAYWFLTTEEATEALEYVDEATTPTKPPEGEICMLSSPSIVVSFEMQVGRETVPVLVMQAKLQGQLKDWSSDLNMESTLEMQVSYYNIARAEWEPLVEPVERLVDCVYKHQPWRLNIEMTMRPGEQRAVIDPLDEALTNRAVATQQANKTITVSSSEPLEITITRTGMEVLTMLSNSLSPSDASTTIKTKSEDDFAKKSFGAPYVLHNCTGLTAKLVLAENDDFTVSLTQTQSAMDYKEVILEAGARVPLRLKHAGLATLKLNEPPPPLKLKVNIVEMSEALVIPVERADKRYFPLGRGTTAGGDNRHIPQVAAYEPRGLISDIVMRDAAVQIYLRSVVQVTNAMQVNVSVYCMTQSGNEVRLLGDVKPGDTLRLPLQAVYTPTAEIFFSVEDFTVSVSPFIWRELQHEVKLTKLLHCDSKDKNSGEKFYLKAVGTMEQVFYGHTNRSTFASSCYDVVLKPAVKLQNSLPVPIVVSQLGLKRTQTFQPGEMFHLSHLAPNRASIVVMIENYLNKCWVCTKNLPEEEEEFSVWSFESHDSPSVMTLDLGMHNVDLEGIQVLSLYCPFWMLNKTGFTLSYRNVDETGNVIFHPKEYKEPILFSFKAKNFFGKKMASIRLEFGEWSDKFSLDVPGSSGVVNCKLEGRTYQVAVQNKLTFNSLTKMVIFVPSFLIINEAPFDIQYQEFNRSADPWQTVAKNSVCPLWPAIEKEEKLLLLKVADSKDVCAPFLYTEQHSTCLKLDNSYGGLTVEVAMNEDGTSITVQQYKPGQAPALIVNYTNFPLTIYEKENVNVRHLPPLHEMLYAWDNPAGPQKLIFEGYKKKEVEVDIRQDGIDQFMVGEFQCLYWVSFLNGMQRVVLVTGDIILAKGAHLVGDSDVVDTELLLSMQGLGLSLVDNHRMQELVYISMSNSGIIWECCKLGSRRYKKVDSSKVIQLEEAYQRYLTQKMVSEEPVPPVVKVADKMEVNFEEMLMIKPNSRILRRTLEPGLWASYGMTTHSVRIHARLHRLQIDQQLPLPTFPVVLAPVPPPRSVANDVGIKPFMEVSIVERMMEHTKVRQYKYYKVLIQEFQLKVDMGLITALLGMFPQKILTEEEALEAFTTDMEMANQPLEALAASGAANDQQNFYDNLHLSPIKVHVSFSLGGATQLPTFIGTILQSIGVTLTDMNDVVFKLSYYERNYEFLSQKELITQVQSHYMGQALKQMYVLVLGLDVIGNPYGLVIGLKKGVEDLFYEPFQGAIQGPGEFAEGLFLGVRSLVGHTVGGAAGAMSRITGAMGHGLAALSLDKDYQRRRRDNMNKPAATLQEGLARSGKGLVMEGACQNSQCDRRDDGQICMERGPTSNKNDLYVKLKGVVDGVTGVFTKPFEGARDEGVEGFFKGLGRGAVGLVARPTAGVVDFAAGSLDAVKRAADLSEEVTKRRVARYLPPETGVRPYSRLKAEGYKILFELEKGKFLTTDTYQAHVWVIPNKDVLLCTDKRLLYLERNQVFGGWQIQWSYLWTEIPEVPTSVNKGVYIPTAKRKVLGMFTTSGAGKVVFLYDDQQRKFFLAQCERLKQAAG